MLRNDGSYTIYKIQHACAPKKKGDPITWTYSNLDHFGVPHDEFNASGKCWQQTGQHGTFNRNVGERALITISKKHPGYTFRLVEVRIDQDTTEAMRITRRAEE